MQWASSQSAGVILANTAASSNANTALRYSVLRNGVGHISIKTRVDLGARLTNVAREFPSCYRWGKLTANVETVSSAVAS